MLVADCPARARRVDRRADLDDHPRVRRAAAHRRDVEVYGDDAGLVVLGHGLVGRRELAVELFDPAGGGGHGRRLIARRAGPSPSGRAVLGPGRPGQRGVAAGVPGLRVRAGRLGGPDRTGTRVASFAGVSIVCPRCGRDGDERFYGPCSSCRDELRAAFTREGRIVEVAEYEPKMNVTPNAVALKDD